jgi:hypothetical protein
LLWGGLGAKRWAESKLKELGKLWKRPQAVPPPKGASVDAFVRIIPIPRSAAMVRCKHKA